MKHRRWAAAVATVALTSTGGCAAVRSGADPVAAPVSPLDGRRFHADPQGSAPRLVRQWLRDGDPRARALEPLARRATGIWLVGQPDTRSRLGRVARAAVERGEVPVVVVYALPHRDCGSHSAGGLRDRETYLAYVRTVVDALAGAEAVVVLEPDAVPQAVVGCAGVDPAARYDMLAQAVEILDRQPGARVYLDAGNATWVDELPELADALRRSGIDQAEGFALNVSNYETTEVSAEYGLELSRELEEGAPAGTPPAHFVIDTSRNGAGPPESAAGDEGRWCNPPGRELGEPPTTSPDLPRVDALLWIKQPGDSDGTCGGGPPAGQWWPEAAAELVADAG